MNSNVLLEDFSHASPAPPKDETPQENYEALRLEAYENGYKSGWGDAIKQTTDENREIGEELSRNLRDARMTYSEAKEELLHGVTDLLHEIFATLLPTILPETVASVVSMTLEDLSSEKAGPVSVSVCSDDLETVRSSLIEFKDPELKILAEPALAPGQARINSGGRIVELDVSRLSSALCEALTDGRSSVHGARKS